MGTDKSGSRARLHRPRWVTLSCRFGELRSKIGRVSCGVPHPKHVHNLCIFIDRVDDPEFGPCANVEQICTVRCAGDKKETPRMRNGCEPCLEDARKAFLLLFP